MSRLETSDLLDPLCAPFRHDSEDGDGVLLVHGWTGSPAHFRMLGAALAEAGYAVSAPLLPGHGTRVEDLADSTWRDWVREVVVASQQLIDEGKRVHMVGLSMGAALCLLAAPVMGAASISVINPALRARSRRGWITPLFRGRPIVLAEPDRIPPDEEALAYFQQYDGNPLGSVADLRDLMRAASRSLRAVSCPALVVQSVVDETIRPESGLIVFREISSLDKQIVWLRTSRHNSLLDKERPVIHQAVLQRIASAR